MTIRFFALLITTFMIFETGNAQKPKDNGLIAFLPLEIHDNIPYVQVRINNADAVWFIVDCGASLNVIDKSLVDSMGLTKVGSIQGTGAGSGTYEVNYLYNLQYRIGNLNFTSD